jgi:hypothetical protein
MLDKSIKGLKDLREEDESSLSGGVARAFGFAEALGFSSKDIEARTSIIVTTFDDGILSYAFSRSSASVALR